MSWAKLDDRFPHHPKLLSAGLAATGLYARSIAYSACYQTDGFVPEAWARSQVAPKGEDTKLPEKLVEAGLWEPADGGFLIHDYLDYQPSRAEWEAEKAAKQKAAEARWSKARNARASASAMPNPNPSPTPRTAATKSTAAHDGEGLS